MILKCLISEFGDSHSHENPALLSLSLLFYRWHNFLVKQFRKSKLSEEDLFYKARSKVIATLQVSPRWTTTDTKPIKKNNNSDNSLNVYQSIHTFKALIDFLGFLYLMAYQPSWVIYCQIYPCWRTAVILFNQHIFPKGISLKVNIIAQLDITLTSKSLYLMAYQPSWVIYCQIYPCWRTAVILFNQHIFP